MNKNARIVLNNLEKAIAAEGKQGFTNAGVLGGFNTFLLGILPRLKQLFPASDLTLLQRIANRYGTWNSLQRRESFREIYDVLLSLQESLNHQSSDVRDDEARENKVLKAPVSTGRNTSQERAVNAAGQGQKVDKVKGVPGKNLAEKPRSEKPRSGTADTSLQYLKGVGPERAKQLSHLGLKKVEDLLLYFPRRYEDRRPKMISELKDGELATLAGKVVAGQVSHGKVKVVKLSLEQNDRLIYAVWFNQAFILKQYPVGTSVIITGKVRWQQRVPEIMVTDIEKAANYMPKQEILPVYSETARLSTKVIRSIVWNVLPQVPLCFPEILPPEDRDEWLERDIAYREIHFPTSYHSLAKARERLVWEEILFLQLAVARLQQGLPRTGSPELKDGNELVKKFVNSLPFGLTNAQKRVIQEIFHDMAEARGMARLVQGDVGSGKTAVAMAALLKAVGSGYQGAMMAPTEILALQHFQSLVKAFAPLGITVICLLGSQSKGEREEVLKKIADGEAEIVVGTHALIQENVNFKKLGLAVTDEQHRFGVRQRTMLQNKGPSPHVLVLTATPIPRTLALTLYGDLQLSIIDEMPAGRKPIMTRKISERTRASLEKFLAEQMDMGRQVYVVCPLVEESETKDMISATERAEYLQKLFPNRRVALLHGRMKGSEKEEIMKQFQSGEITILVATTVVEVGVNVPNATVMVVEDADRFGLAQLHQLRGRVGRGSEQSYCFLVSENKNSRRLDVLCQTQDGFKIAEEDLRLRGPGELLGTRQHGLAELRLADLSRDGRLVEKAYQMAQKVLQSPQDYTALWQEVDHRFAPEKVGIH